MHSYKNKKKIIRLAIMAAILAGAAPLAAGAAGNTTAPNNTLPQNGQTIMGKHEFSNPNQNTLNIVQTGQNGVIQWGSFDIGANGTVNFSRNDGGQFNTLNYVTGGNSSQIYGKLNAAGGNIYLVNPNGVQIGNSAQINVGSLYVSNRKLSEENLNTLKNSWDGTENIGGTVTTAELMSLGHITANTVTFDGDRVVIDGDRVQATSVKAIGLGNDEGYNIVWGVTKDSATPAGKAEFLGRDAQSGKTSALDTKNYTYTWVQNAADLQNIGKDSDSLKGNYALRHAIDLTGVDNFTPIGSKNSAFTGKLDGLGNNIFGLTLNKNTDYTGLFGYTDGAIIGYLNLISGTDGTAITGGQYVGALIGYAKDTKVKSVTSTLDVTGNKDVGGLIGGAEDSKFYNLINTGTISGHDNVGGLIGSMNGGSLGAGETNTVTDEESHNIGRVTGKDADNIKNPEDDYSHNIGGLVGLASGASIGNAGGKVIYNGSAVTGGYNVGGIVGKMENSTIVNAANNARITATGYIGEVYKYHGNEEGGLPNGGYGSNFYTDDEKTIIGVHVSNAGGIAGSTSGGSILHVSNTGDVTTGQTENQDDPLYMGGNVGGIAGRVTGTAIDNAENKENHIFGSHNIGGIAGYVEGESIISNALNNGGEISGTGALTDKGFAEEVVVDNRDKANHIGNIGGIAGYMYGGSVYIKDSANRGYIHSMEDMTKESSKAGNIGGVVGKFDRTSTLTKETLEKDYGQAAVSNSYNTGDVKGYLNVGGVAGMMYNGEIAGSYNSGAVNTTRNSKTYTGTLNMGGIVGETTEGTSARVLLYDVYNRGDIGDKTFTAGSRHVGGIVGRLSGDVESSYNKGNIYNNAVATGGIVGWMTKGSVNNSFNAGNITVKNIGESDYSGVGGIVGGTGYASTGKMPEEDKILTIQNVYNLGVLRNFGDASSKDSLGGIIGVVSYNTKTLNISNVYTTGEMYLQNKDNNVHIGSIYGSVQYGGQTPKITNAYYIKPQDNSGFTAVNDNQATGIIEYNNRHNAESYGGLFENDEDKGGIKGDWRIYDGTTPILNAFLPKLAEGDVNQNIQNNAENIASIQYGNAYNPFATLITAKEGSTITINDKDAGAIGSVDSIIVRGGGLTVSNAVNTGNTMYSGTLYADGALTLGGSQIRLGSISNLYGSTVKVHSDGDLKAYGNIISTGTNGENGVTIGTTGGDVEILGLVKNAAKGEFITVEGMNGTASDKVVEAGSVADSSAVMPEVGAQYSFTTGAAQKTGNIVISAKGDGNMGNVDVLYGNLGRGHLASSGDVSITGSDIFVDSDLTVAGKIDIYSDSTHDAVIDVSHLGGTGNADGNATAEAVQNFFTQHKGNITFHSSDDNAVNAKIAIDMWKDGAFDFTKFDKDDTTLGRLLDSFQVNSSRQMGGEASTVQIQAADVVYTWVGTAEQLAGIQKYAEKSGDDKAKDILGFNFALKNDIDASTIADYQAIGSGDTAYTGHFDGMDHRIIGLSAEGGLFGTIGTEGTEPGIGGSVENVRIYSSKIATDDNGKAGAIAAKNHGMISNVTGLGNSILAGNKAADRTSSIGGLVGSNAGFIEKSSDMSTVIAGAGIIAGGLAGTNSGSIYDVETSSAVTTNLQKGDQKISQVGGIAGSNTGKIDTASVHGVTGKTGLTETAGGITGSNSGSIENVYNESILRGTEGIGGIAGVNTNSISNAANAMEVKGDANTSKNIGGLVGDQQSGSITNGRNTGTITGHENVGGLVGTNGKDSTLSNLENGPTASITGDTNVGGIAGSNAGNITADDMELENNGKITGTQYVGGIAGTNSGTIKNVNSKVNLYVNAGAQNAQYFGGVTGENKGTITNAVYSGELSAEGAKYVGGITGVNEKNGRLQGTLDEQSKIGNEGKVTGTAYVGGIAGLNKQAIANGTLYNSGEVISTGTEGGAGGIFGENTAAISGTSMKNTVDGQVSGQGTTGGLIGKNSGAISGGRDSGDNYYQHYIVNNGTVNGGTGANVGGLIGENTGSLTAAYNTGAVKGGDSTGGVVGANSGTIDQVFNTVMTKDGQNQTITGTTNVGGIVGTNAHGGSVTNAYNASTIIGTDTNAVTGQIAGANSGTTSNVYGSGTLIGSGTGSVTNGYNISQTGTDWKKQNSYSGFDFAGTDGKAEWKIYEGHGTPLLKVFLTKVNYNGDKNSQKLTYNGQDQSFDIDKLISDKALTTVDSAHDNFAAYHANNTLIQSASHKDAGTYTDWLYSSQIGSSGQGDAFNPNHLGYDVDMGSVVIGKKQITVTDFLASIVYGNQKGQGLVLDISTGTLQDIVSGDDVHLDLSGKQLGIASSSEYADAKGNRVTADVRSTAYDGLTVGGLTLTGNDAKNYDFNGTGTGSIKVTPADLTIQVNDETIMKGQTPHYSIGSIAGLVNGDTSDSMTAGVKDSSVEGVVGTHINAIGVWQGGNWYNQDNASSINTNYNISLTPGTLTVLDLMTPPVPDDRWDYLFDDNPWGRQRNFRERKAEIYFLEGAFWY